jgi:polyphosphate kinase
MTSGSQWPAPAGSDVRVRQEPAPKIFVNRELSFLEFNQRIVEEAADPSVPLLERVKFVSIVSSNLDEFFMIRAAGLKQQQRSGVMETGPDGMLPAELLKAISERVARQIADQERVLLDDLVPALAKEGIHLSKVADLDPDATALIERRFRKEIFPMLTPMAVDPGHPFPLIRNRTINLAIRLLPERSAPDSLPLMALVQVPSMLPRLIDVSKESELRVVFIEDVIMRFVGALFPGMWIIECVPFRVLRNWDLKFDEEEQEDLLEAVQKELRRRGRLDAVRLEIAQSASQELANDLCDALKLGPDDIHRHRAPLALVDLQELTAKIGRPDLRDEAFASSLPTELREAEDVFAEIARRDILLHHPYESYELVVDLLAQAATDPAVLAIKQTLYRTTRDSPIVRSLITAAEHGKQVTALVELKARFDEEANVVWARMLEEAGVHVVYGMIGLKTHCKVTLVVRREPTGVRRYVHIGTGNYNEKTASIYSDLSYFSSREEITSDVAALFNILTGYSEAPAWRKLIVAPMDLRRQILEKIEATRSVAKQGEKAKIIIKTNALIDAQVVRALAKAAQSGVEVSLLVRGPCSLRVGLPGVSDQNITVRLVVDRFLEHARIVYFSAQGKEEVFITSTDIMPRNFDRRVEVMVPIEDEALKRRIVDEILATELMDDAKASILEPSGSYKRISSKGAKVRAQSVFISLARQRAGAPPKAKKGPKLKKKDKKK